MTDPSPSAYQYQNRQGIRPISWQDFHGLCKGLALSIAGYDPDCILGIARAGLYPATLLSHLLPRELYPIRLTRRLSDIVVRTEPAWIVRPPALVAGQRVLLVDEICDSGQTLRLASAEVLRMGAAQVRSAVLYSHRQAQELPDYIGLISDELILNPWDREILRSGQYIFHPEYADALDAQGVTVDSSLLPGIDPIPPAK